MAVSEFEIIRRYFAESGLQFARDGVTLGIGDDCALIQPPEGMQLALSLDVLVAGVHFPEHAAPALLAQRSLAVNLSDLAAMGAEPLCFTLGLTLPSADESWLADFSKGMLVLAQACNCPLIGGDLTQGPLQIAIQVHGLVTAENAIRRSGATAGDRIYVSGAVGDGALALASMNLPTALGDGFRLEADAPLAEYRQYFADAFYKPNPRIQLALALAPLVTSGIDISDGLAGDLGHILRASGVGARLELATLPFSEAATHCATPANCTQAALYGGDDYELCVTVAPAQCAAAEAAAAATGTRFTCIGEIVADAGLRGIERDGREQELAPAAYQHFKEQAS